MIGDANGLASLMTELAASPTGTPPADSTGAASTARSINPLRIASGPFVGATPPRMPVATTRSGIAYAAASV